MMANASIVLDANELLRIVAEPMKKKKPKFRDMCSPLDLVGSEGICSLTSSINVIRDGDGTAFFVITWLSQKVEMMSKSTDPGEFVLLDKAYG